MNHSRTMLKDFVPDLTPAQKSTVAIIQADRQRIAKARRDGHPVSKDDLEIMIFKASESHYMQSKKVRAEIDLEIDKHRETWEGGQDPARQALELARYSQTFGSMTKPELTDAMGSYMSEPVGDPDRVRSLRTACRSAGVDTDGMDKAMAKARWDEPWLNDCKDLVAVRQLYDSKFGSMTCVSTIGVEPDIKITELYREIGDDE